ncbi:MAG TPA: NAD(+) diphosphatase [Natronosporangium sp.]|jgi:NAD+ diphosphatase
MNGPPLARSGVDRAAHRRTDEKWLEEAWGRSRVLLVDTSGRTLCRLPGGGDPAGGGPPGAPEGRPELVFVSAGDAPDGDRLFLGVDAADTPYFAVVTDLPSYPGAVPVTVREVGALLGDRDAGLFVTAAALVRWHASHRYAPATGELTRIASGGWLRVDASGGQLFPRTDPAVIVLVHDGVPGPEGRCLLGRNAAWRGSPGGHRFFSTLAGFVEPGESAEAAVVREVREEVGVEVSDLRYVGSQAWPFPASLMLGFTAVADPARPLRPDRTEIVEARWFRRDEIADLLARGAGRWGLRAPAGGGAGDPGGDRSGGVILPGPASIANYLIRTWCHADEADAAGR